MDKDKVSEWLVNHYVANDLLFADDARRRVLEEHPELNTEEFKEQREAIEERCSVDSRRKTERKYFRGGPPTMDEGLNGALMTLYNHVKYFMDEGLKEAKRLGEIEIDPLSSDSYDTMHDLWALSFVSTLHEEDVYLLKNSGIGLERLEHIYLLSRFFPQDDSTPLSPFAKFCNYNLDHELVYLKAVYEEYYPAYRENVEEKLKALGE